MPFKSKAQLRWMFANHPEMAKRWAKHTEDTKALPEKADSEEEKKAFAFLDAIVKEAVSMAMNLKPKPTPSVKPKPLGAPVPGIISNGQQYGANLQTKIDFGSRQQLRQPQQQPMPMKYAFLTKWAFYPTRSTSGTNAGYANTVPSNQPTQAPKPAPQGDLQGLKGGFGNILGEMGRSFKQDLGLKPSRQIAPAVQADATATPTKWTQSLISGQGGFALPNTVSSRLQDVTPEGRARAQELYHMRNMLPKQEAELFKDPDRSITQQDVDRMSNYENQEFSEFAKENMPMPAQTGQMPHYLDILRNPQATPQQKQVANAYVMDMQRRQNVGSQLNLQQGDLQQENIRNETAENVGNQVSETLTGLTTKNINDPLAAGMGMATSVAGFAVPYGRAFQGLKSLPYLRNATVGGEGIFKGFNPFVSPASAVKTMTLTPARGAQVGGGVADVITGSRNYANTGVVETDPFARDLGEGAGRILSFGVSPNLTGIAGLFPYTATELNSLNAPENPDKVRTGWGGLPNSDTVRDIGTRLTGTDQQKTNLTDTINARSLIQQNNKDTPAIANYGAAASRALNPQEGMANATPEGVAAGVKGIPGYYAASAFNFGSVGADVDKGLEGIGKLPPEQQAAAMANLEQTTQNKLGINLKEYQQTKLSMGTLEQAKTNLDTAIKQYDEHISAAGAVSGKEDPAFAQRRQAAAAAYDKANEDYAKQFEPVLGKMIDARYKNEIAPLEQGLPALAKQIEGINQKRQAGQPLTDQEAQAVQQAGAARTKAYEFGLMKAQRAMLLNQDLKDPEVAKVMADPNSEAAMKLISSKLQDTVIDPQTGEEVKNNSPMIQEAKTNLEGHVDQATGGALSKEKEQREAVENQTGQEQPKGMVENFIDSTWGKMNDTEKFMTFAGLGVAAIGAFSSMFGGGDDDEEGGGGGGLMTMLGLAAGLFAPAMQYFGFGNVLGLPGGAGAAPGATGPAGPPAAAPAATTQQPAVAGQPAPAAIGQQPAASGKPAAPAATQAPKPAAPAAQAAQTTGPDVVAKSKQEIMGLLQKGNKPEAAAKMSDMLIGMGKDEGSKFTKAEKLHTALANLDAWGIGGSIKSELQLELKKSGLNDNEINQVIANKAEIMKALKAKGVKNPGWMAVMGDKPK